MSLHEKGRAVQREAELKKINTAIQKEKDKIELLQHYVDTSRKKHTIVMNEREITMLQQKIAEMKRRRKKLLEEKESE